MPRIINSSFAALHLELIVVFRVSASLDLFSKSQEGMGLEEMADV